MNVYVHILAIYRLNHLNTTALLDHYLSSYLKLLWLNMTLISLQSCKINKYAIVLF
jgi:hypothetical protein